MITFYGFGSAFGLPDPSPFVMKSEIQLKMAGVPYRFERGAPPAAPKGKIPFIRSGAHRVGDSTFIRAHIEKEYGFDFDSGLGAEQRALAWAVERMLEDHLYFAILAARWLDDENWEKGPSHFFDGAPEGVAQASREQVRRTLHGHGIGRHREDEIAELGGRSLASLSTLLGDKPFLFGDAPCGADATAFAFAAAALTPFFESALCKRAESHPNLASYCERSMRRFYPEFVKRAA